MTWLNKLMPGQRIKDGIRGQAVVLSINQYVDQSSSARMPIRLMVHVEGREPYPVKHTCFVPRTKYPFPGTSLPVTVDRADPERIRIEWDEVQTADERLDQRYRLQIGRVGRPPYRADHGSPGSVRPRLVPRMTPRGKWQRAVAPASDVRLDTNVDLRPAREVRSSDGPEA